MFPFVPTPLPKEWTIMFLFFVSLFLRFSFFFFLFYLCSLKSISSSLLFHRLKSRPLSKHSLCKLLRVLLISHSGRISWGTERVSLLFFPGLFHVWCPDSGNVCFLSPASLLGYYRHSERILKDCVNLFPFFFFLFLESFIVEWFSSEKKTAFVVVLGFSIQLSREVQFIWR